MDSVKMLGINTGLVSFVQACRVSFVSGHLLSAGPLLGIPSNPITLQWHHASLPSPCDTCEVTFYAVVDIHGTHQVPP